MTMEKIQDIQPEVTPPTEKEMKKQIVIDVDGVQITVNHYYNGTKSIREVYEDFLERKLKNS